MEKSQSALVEQEAAEKVAERIRRKCDEVTRAVRQKANEYVNAIRNRERRLLNEVSEKFHRMDEGFKALRQLPHELQDRINRWKQRTHESLVTVTEKSERGEIAFDLLEDRSNVKNDPLAWGEKLILDIERINEVNARVLENNLRKVNVVFDEGFMRNLETLCVIDVPEINVGSVVNLGGNTYSTQNSREDTQGSLPLGDIINTSPKKAGKEESRSMQEISQSSFIELRQNSMQNLNRSPSKQASVMFPDRSAVQDEDNYFRIKLGGIDEMIRGPSDKELDDEPNLLNFEWEASPENSTNSGNMRREFVGKQPHSLADIGTVNRENYKNPGRSENMNATMQGKFDKEDGLTSKNKKNTTARATSPWKKSGSEQTAAKNVKTKKRTVKVADKFEAVVEGIEQNSIDTADLTAAELGDQGILTLVEYLKENTMLKSLKLLKNKITDEAGVALAGLLCYNKTLHTLNLTQNQLTEKTLDAFIEVIKTQRPVKLKSLYLSQNSMSLRNVKGKLKELAELGVNAIV